MRLVSSELNQDKLWTMLSERARSGLGNKDPADGFGQSLLADLRFLWRFRRCRKTVIDWRKSTADEAAAQEAHPIVARFGDVAVAVAEVGGRQWIVRERDWHGWPDPPRYVFFALDGGAVWAARDFDTWPGAWRRP